MSLAATLYRSADRRADPRRPVGAGSTLRADSGGPLDVRVHDLSTGGFRIDSDTPLSEGARISIGLPGVGVFPAIVVRRDATGYGCRFDALLSPQALAAAFRADPVVAGRFATLALADGGLPEPAITPWPAPLRLAILAGLTAGLWSAILLVV